jgi:ligand-binding sensor domain-containing protein
MKYAQAFTFLTTLLVATACNGPDKKGLIKGSPNRYVQCSLQDKSGNLWFGTREDGLYKYDGKSFSQFLVTNGLNSNNIYCMLEDKEGKIWIGTKVGLCLYNGKTFAEIHIPLRRNQPPNKNELYGHLHWVFSIMQAKSGKLWFATIDGVYIYDGKSFTPFTVDESSSGYASNNNNVEHMIEDKAGNMWFGGRGNEGVYRYDGKSVINIKLKELSSIPDSIRNGKNWAWPQLQDKNGNIWFSNWGGAYRYDGKSFTGFTKKEGLSADAIFQIIEDNKGNLWFGGAGLCRYNGKLFKPFTTKDGRANQGVRSILEDKTGNLWLGGGAGISRYDEKNLLNSSL